MPDAEIRFIPKDDEIRFVPMAQPAEQPGVLHRLLSAYQQGSQAIRQEQQRRNPGGGLLGKDSGDLVAGAGTLLSGVQGRQPGSAEQEQRLGRFSQEHPLLAPALRLGGGLASPVPGVPAAKGATAAAPAAATAVEEATPVAAQAAGSAPTAINPWIGGMPAEAAPVAGAAANIFEKSARAAKVQSLAKTIEANTIAHLGSEAAQTPHFADTIAKMPAEWWEGMAKIAKVNKPSETTVGEVAAFFRDRALQTGQASSAVELSPTIAAALKEEVPLQGGALLRAATKLRAMPSKPLDLLDLLAAGHYGVPQAAALKLARNYGPRIAAAGLETVGRAPGVVGVTAANALRGAGETSGATLQQLLAELQKKRSDQMIGSNP